MSALNRIANPFVKALLRSPIHWALSGSVMLLSFRGHRSGRSYTMPVMYATAPDGSLLVVPGHPERKRWWRNLQGGAPVRVRVGRNEQDGVGEVVDGAAARAEAERVYFARFPKARKALGGDHTPVVRIRT